MQITVKFQIIVFLGTVRCLGYFNYLGNTNPCFKGVLLETFLNCDALLVSLGDSR